MTTTSLIGHCAELLRIINKSNNAPDIIAGQYLRSKKYLGSNDRKFISTVVFYILRIKSIPEYCIEQLDLSNIVTKTNYKENQKTSLYDVLLILAGIYALERLGIAALPDNHIDIQATTVALFDEKFSIPLNDVRKPSEQLTQSIDYIITRSEEIKINNYATKNDIHKAAIRFAMPLWILESLIKDTSYTSDELKQLFESFFYPAPLTLRINSHPSAREKILMQIMEFDPSAKNTPYSPFGIQLSKRFDLNTIPLYKQGLIEVQDEGSQLISIALGPEENDFVLDACAGAGGKTLHIANLTNDNSTIYASDIELRKLKELNKRTRRAGFRSITTYLPKNLDKSLIGKFDKVLIDAPCSGMGTVRRNPMLKWRLTPKMLDKYNQKQYKILEQYSSYVAEGGILLYATCSILPQENEFTVKKFLDNHPEFSSVPLKPAFEKFNISLPNLGDNDFQYQLLPSVHNCDGFYFSKLIRK